MLRTLGQADVPVEGLPQALAELAGRHHDLLERLRRLEGADPAVADLNRILVAAHSEGKEGGTNAEA